MTQQPWSARLVVALLMAAACQPESEAAGTCEVDPGASEVAQEDTRPWPVAPGPCRLDVEEPTRLVVTTTDFSTGALSVLDLSTGTMSNDRAPTTTDAIPYWGDDRLLVVNRFGFDFVEAFDPMQWRSSGQHPIEVGCVASPNPHAAIVGPEGLAYVTLFGAPYVEVMDVQRPPGASAVDRIDMRPFADADGNPEAGAAVRCGDTLYVAMSRLDADFQRVDVDVLAAVDLPTRTPLDADAKTPGLQGLPVSGAWIRQLRRDPADPNGTTLLALTTGIERIDLATGNVHWAVPEDAFAQAGIDHFRLPQSFDLGEDGTTVYFAAYGPDDDSIDCSHNPTSCFSQVRLYRVGLDGAPPVVPEAFAGGFDSVERTLEVVDDVLWYGSTRVDAPGLWRFDLSTDPPTMASAPLSTGLPPYAMVAIP